MSGYESEAQKNNEHSTHQPKAEMNFSLWHSSMPFVIVTFALVNLQSFFALFSLIIAVVISVTKQTNDDWYKYRWPWLVIAVLAVSTISNQMLSALERFAAN